MALIYVVMLTAMVTMFLGTSVTYSIGASRAGRYELTKNIQAKNVARAGLQAVNTWFDQQAARPVRQSPSVAGGLYPDMAFYPRYNADQALRETDDEAVGLVRDVPISDDGRLWGHYVVPRQTVNNEPAAGGDAAKTDQFAAHDISHLRTSQPKGSGIVWRVTSVAYVYVRNDLRKRADGTFEIAFDQAPNQVLDKFVAQTELQRLAINTPPIPLVYDGGSVSLSNKSRIVNSSGAAITYGGSASPPTGVSGNVQGSPQTSWDLLLKLDPIALFSVTETELMGLADQLVYSTAELKDPLPTSGIIFVKGNASFNTSRRLIGGGILYVTDDLTIDTDCANWSGIVFVGGKLTLKGGNFINGTVLLRGGASIVSNTDITEITYNDTVIQMMRNRLGNYRANNLSFKALQIG